MLGLLIEFGVAGVARGQIPNVFDPPVTQVAAGGFSTCALTAADGEVECWGAIAGTPGTVPITMGLSGVTAISVGLVHLCALTKAGGVQCLGDNALGELGNGQTAYSSIPVAVKGLEKGAAAIAAGGNFTCALNTSGAVLCWGGNVDGQLGNNSTVSSSVPVPVSSLSGGVVAIAASRSDYYVCALTMAGAVKCWGHNNRGQLGNGSAADSSVPVAVSGLSSGVIAIAAGIDHTCALTQAGAVWCWGANDKGQLGTGKQDGGSPVPVPVSGLNSGIAAIAAGSARTCALTSAGAALCWGADYLFGGSVLIPALVPGLSAPLTSITAGDYHACGSTLPGAVSCWGSNDFGQLGNGTFSGSLRPAAVIGLNGVATAASVSDTNSCILAAEGSVKCRGGNQYGQLGSGATGKTFVDLQIDRQSLGNGGAATAVAVGSGFICALIQGSVQCLGKNDSGQLGNKSLANSSVPVSVSGLSGITAISAGDDHACALDSNGGVSCWGFNHYGSLGSDTFLDFSSVPLPVNGLSSGVSAIAAGTYDTCAIVGGGVRCWGSNAFGELGNGSNTDSSAPVAVKGLGSIQQIAVGAHFACALRADATVWCWGNNADGELGNNSNVSSALPVQVGGLSGKVTAIAAGWQQACVLTAAGAVQCWGGSGFTDIGSKVPVTVDNGSKTIAAVFAGADTLCELTSAGELACWGADSGDLFDPTGGTYVKSPFVPTFSQSLSFSTPASLTTGTTLTLSAVAHTSRANGSFQSADGADADDHQPVTFDTWTPDTCTVSGTTLTVTAKAAGLCGVRASQIGGADASGLFANSTFTPAPQQLRLIQVQGGPPASTTTLTDSISSGVFGQSVSFTATVSGNAPTGNVTFSDGATVLCTAALSGGGNGPAATCSSATLAVGTHSITAAYAGDANNAASASSATLSYVVAKAATTVTVSPAGASILSGTSLKVAGNVSVTSPGAGTPTGMVTIAESPNGASCSYSLAAAEPGCTMTPKGTYAEETLTAAYSGDDNFAASNGTTSLIVTLSLATVTLTSSPNPSAFGHAVTFTATVTSQGATPTARATASGSNLAAAVPTGTITLRDNGVLLASIALNVGGQATYSTSTLSAGSHTITANYSGDANTAPASSTLTQQVAAAAPVGPAPALSPMAMLLLGLGFIGVAGHGIARSGSEASLGGSARRR